MSPRDAAAQELVVDLSDPLVAITTGFVGTRLVLFGSAESRGDVVVVVRGPLQDAVVRRKERVAGIWVNRTEVAFRNIPSFYTVAANRPVAEFLPKDVADIHEIGLANLEVLPEDPDKYSAEQLHEFREALIRNKQREGLYKRDVGNVIFLSPRLFRTAIVFPANTPVGTYGIEVYLIRNADIAAHHTTLLNVRKFGIEASLYDFAHQHAALYGLLAILIAMMAGWLASVAFRQR
ncbi:MAG: hypothetical protein EXQ86_05195 [Rhodospirillales bacterium]|nr:hypothetical protein [Rhodospirillales bacterium]